MRDPPQANHLTLLCGPPSGRIVARCANSGLSSRSTWLAGASGIGFSSLAVSVMVVPLLSYQDTTVPLGAGPRTRCPSPAPVRPVPLLMLLLTLHEIVP